MGNEHSNCGSACKARVLEYLQQGQAEKAVKASCWNSIIDHPEEGVDDVTYDTYVRGILRDSKIIHAYTMKEIKTRLGKSWIKCIIRMGDHDRAFQFISETHQESLIATLTEEDLSFVYSLRDQVKENQVEKVGYYVVQYFIKQEVPESARLWIRRLSWDNVHLWWESHGHTIPRDKMRAFLDDTTKRELDHDIQRRCMMRWYTWWGGDVEAAVTLYHQKPVSLSSLTHPRDVPLLQSLSEQGVEDATITWSRNLVLQARQTKHDVTKWDQYQQAWVLLEQVNQPFPFELFPNEFIVRKRMEMELRKDMTPSAPPPAYHEQMEAPLKPTLTSEAPSAPPLINV